MFRIVHPKDLRRTQNTVPRAALRFALGYLIMPLWGWGPMVHRRDLQTGHSPVLQKERDQTHAPSVPRFHGPSSRRSQLQPIGPGMFLIVPNGCMDTAMPGRFYLSERNLLLRVASMAGRGTGIEGV